MSGFGIDLKINSQVGPQIGRLSQENRIADTEESSEKGSSFGDTLKTMMQDANNSQIEADHKIEELAAGRNKDIHGTVLSMEKADIDFRMLTQVRNKVIEAYREIMRMQI